MTDTKTTPRTKIDPDAMGVELSWSFGNGDAEAVTMPRAEFVRILNEHGFQFRLGWRGRETFGYLPDVSADAALRKAQHTVKGRSKEIVIQELRRPNKDTPRAFGVYRVIGKEGEAGDNVRMGARVRVTGDTVKCLPPEGELAFTDTSCEKIGREIKRIALSLIDNVINRDISDCLTDIGWSELAWVSRRRNSGGVYFAATTDVTERFVAMLQALASFTEAQRPGKRHRHFVPQIMEVYPKPLSMSMWAGATEDQFAVQTEQLMAKLQHMREAGTMRDKTKEAHAAECDRLMEQAAAHRALLADKVEEITLVLTAIRDDFNRALDESAAGANAALDAVAAVADAQPKRKRTRRQKPTSAPEEKRPEEMSADELFNID